MNVEKAKQVLKEHGYIQCFWTKCDVIHIVEEEGYLFTEEMVEDVIGKIERHHNAEVGINWENIRFHVNEVYEEHKEK